MNSRPKPRRYPKGVDPILTDLATVDPADLNGWRSRFPAFADRLYDRESLDTIPPSRPLIDGVLEAGAVTVLAGKHGSLKTFTAVSWAGSVATGLPWLGHKVPEPGPVLYIVAEGASSFRLRIAAWEYLWNERRRINRDALVIHSGAVNLFDAAQATMLHEYVKVLQPRLVVIDTLRKCSAGAAENSNDDMGLVIGRAEEIAVDTGAAFVINHHAGHEGGRPRGASAIGDDSSGIWLATGDSSLTKLENTKVKDGEEHPAMSIRLVVERSLGSGAIEQVGASDVRDAADADGEFRAVMVAREQFGASVFVRTQLRDALGEIGVPKASANRHITKAVEKGYLEATSDTGRSLRVNLARSGNLNRLMIATHDPKREPTATRADSQITKIGTPLTSTDSTSTHSDSHTDNGSAHSPPIGVSQCASEPASHCRQCGEPTPTHGPTCPWRDRATCSAGCGTFLPDARPGLCDHCAPTTAAPPQHATTRNPNGTDR